MGCGRTWTDGAHGLGVEKGMGKGWVGEGHRERIGEEQRLNV